MTFAKKILKEALDPNDLLTQIVRDFSTFRPGKSFDKQGPYINFNTASYEFRHLGNWIHDSDLMNDPDYDDDSFEDDDNEIWAPGEFDKYMKIFTMWSKNFQWAAQVKLEINSSEKNWVSFDIILK